MHAHGTGGLQSEEGVAHTEGLPLQLFIFDWGWQVSIVYDALGVDPRS